MSLFDDLVGYFHIGPVEMLHLISTAPARYKQYTIPKRHGGTRTIAQPSRELKALQRYILEKHLSTLPVHDAATGYIKRRNILYNAAQHRQNRVIMKLDFRDFFPSITTRDWNIFVTAKRPPAIDRRDNWVYRNILFWGQRSRIPKCLSIGAPTSPALSNILLFDLDTRLFQAAVAMRVVYTRYADDITVSGESIEAVVAFEQRLLRILARMRSPALVLNDEKRGIYLKGQRRMVTGLILTPTGSVSIGRERKRLISVMLHKVYIGKSDGEHMSYLKGMLGFCLATEPDFVSRLRIKYGSDVVDRVLRFTPPRRASRF